MHSYCSVISRDYIHRGLMLYDSLKKYDKDFVFIIICLSNEVKELLNLMELDNTILLTMKQIENADQELLATKSQRNDKEYIWTSKASILLYIFENFIEFNHVIWLDSDIVFYSDAQPIIKELDKCSILLTRERFKGKNQKLDNVFGIFNTGLMGFRRNNRVIKCIKEFREECIEWCYDYIVQGKWSDQMYVNKWPRKYSKVRIIENVGINVTGWNIQKTEVSKRDNSIYINDSKLVFYHYSGFRFINYNEFDLCCYIKLSDEVKKIIYKPYIKKYREMIKMVNEIAKDFYNGSGNSKSNFRNYYYAGGE